MTPTTKTDVTVPRDGNTGTRRPLKSLLDGISLNERGVMRVTLNNWYEASGEPGAASEECGEYAAGPAL